MNRSRLFREPVTLVRLAWVDSRGTTNPVATLETTVKAAVQPMRSDRRIAFDLPTSSTAYSLYLPTDPGLGVDDRVLWRGRTLRVLAPARDQAGRGIVWALDLVELETEASR